MYDYAPKYGDKAKLCYTDADSFIVHVKSEDVADLAGDVETRFDISNYEVGRPIGKNKVIGLIKDELSGGIMKNSVALRPKIYSYLADDGCVDEKVNGTKKCIIKHELKFGICKPCLESNEIVLKLQQKFRSEAHNVFTEKVNKIALRTDNDKRIQAFDRSTFSPHIHMAQMLTEFTVQNSWNL